MQNKTDKQPERTEAGRGAIKKLGSPKEIQRQNILTVLIWLYRWGFSTADILSDLLKRSNRSHARRMEKNGWVRSVSIKGYPTYFVLTEKGLAEAIHHSTVLLDYKERDPYRVNLPKLHHDLLTQKETIMAMREGGYQDFITLRMFDFDEERRPLKIPDVILVEKLKDEFGLPVDELTGVEVELTPKWDRDLDQFVTNIVDDILGRRLDKFIIITDSNAIQERYGNAFKPGNQIKRWSKTSGSKFVESEETLQIQNWIAGYVFFREVGSKKDNYPSHYLP